QYVHDVRSRKATLVLLSPVPRNYWQQDGTLDQVMSQHATITRQVAAGEGVPFVDLHQRLVRIYTALGRDRVTSTFFTVGDATHPNAAGAEIAAYAVIDGLRELSASGLGPYLEPTALRSLTAKSVTWARGI